MSKEHLWSSYRRVQWPNRVRCWYCTHFGDMAFQIQNYILKREDLTPRLIGLLGRGEACGDQQVYQASEEVLVEFSICVHNADEVKEVR